MTQGRVAAGGAGRGRVAPQRRPTGSKGKAGGVQKKKRHASFKSMIRGCQRLLAKEDLDPKIRAAQEAKLADYTEKMEEQQKAEIERKYAIRYHKIKFFDRVKAERHQKQLLRNLKAAVLEGEEDIVMETRAKLETANQHVMYVQHFPKGEKYVSLFKGEGEEIEAERSRLMSLVRKQQMDLAVVTEADEGLSLAASQQPATPRVQGPANTAIAQPQPATGRGSRRKRADPQPAEAAPPMEAEVVQKRGSRRKPAAAPASQVAQEEVVPPKAEPKAGGGKLIRAPSVETVPVEKVANLAAQTVVETPTIETPADDFAGFDDFFVTSDAAAEPPARVEMVRVPAGAHIDEKQPQPRRRDGISRHGDRGTGSRGGAQFGQQRKPVDRHGGGVAKRTEMSKSIGHDKMMGHSRRAPDAERPKSAGKSQAKSASESASKQPVRTRAEGGRKRRAKKK